MGKLKEQLTSSEELLRQRKESMAMSSTELTEKYRQLDEKEACITNRERDLEICAEALAREEERIAEMRVEAGAQQAKVNSKISNPGTNIHSCMRALGSL